MRTKRCPLDEARPEQISWDDVENPVTDGAVVESKIVGFNKGGLIASVEGLRGFVPSSQIGALRRSQISGETPNKNIKRWLGSRSPSARHRSDRERRRLILSERGGLTESRQSLKERVIDGLEEGQVYTGA